MLRPFRNKRGRTITAAVVAAAASLSGVLALVQLGQRSPTPFTPVQRVYGHVALTAGNCLPGPGQSSGCRTSYISTAVYIRRPVPLGAMDSTYLRNPTELVATATSNGTGFFELQVPAGAYSVLAEDGGREYRSEAAGTPSGIWMCPLVVGTEPVEHNVAIDHAAH